MTKQIKLLILSTLLLCLRASAQNSLGPEQQFIKRQVDTLTSATFHGRGYVQDGVSMASKYLQQKFVEYGIKPGVYGSSYTQRYQFPVNTFPGKMQLSINGKYLKPGADYIIDVRSTSFYTQHLPVETIDMAMITDDKKLKKAARSFDAEHAWLLLNFDSCFKMLHEPGRDFLGSLPKGCYLVPQKAKLTWDVAMDTMDAAVFYIKEASMPADPKEATVNMRSKFIPRSWNENIVGMVPGEVKDSFIVFSAHYDHLGMMGDSSMFPGGSDNASGTAMMLYLASYFVRHPQHYTIVFIAFSGEEPGLMGSAWFVTHPVIPLNKIKFLTNIDIMGDATDGVTVVNATEFPKQFQLLKDLNERGKYLPAIVTRGKAANSDHYFFTEAGVPSFFIYSNGGKGFYHDIFDVGSEVTLNHIDGMAKLMIDFIKELN